MKDPNGPFAKNSPQQAADFFLRKDNFQIREWARSVVRKDNKWKLRQAEAFDDVRLVDPRQDIVTNVVEVVRGLPGIASAPGSLTPNEQEGFVLETARRLLDDYPQDVRDQVARSGGISIFKLRAHTKDYDEAGHSSAKDRQIYSRACRKIAKAFTSAAVLSLLMVVLAFALSLSLFIAIQPGRALQQYDFVNQSCFDHQNDLAHQGNFIDPDPLAHQDT
ncbi:MAG TPA: hypothetical protein VJV03_08520 [Pyrinomonadaceae bacterium]|nr:hypothetical protein [Pyrinomonadaceae bacterium]